MPRPLSRAASALSCCVRSLVPRPLSRAASTLSCRVRSLVPRPFSCRVRSRAASVLVPRPFLCRVHSRAVSVLVPRPFSCRVHSPVPLLHPHPRCINPPSPGLSWLHRCPDLCAPCRMPRSSSTPLHCTLCSACVVPPPPPTPLPRLMRASVSVPVRLYTCYFTCIRIRL